MIREILIQLGMAVLVGGFTFGVLEFSDWWRGRKKAKKERSGDLFRLLDTKHIVLMAKTSVWYHVAATRAPVRIDGDHSFVVTVGDPRDVFGELADIAFQCGKYTDIRKDADHD
jgi:hypothetical protein